MDKQDKDEMSSKPLFWKYGFLKVLFGLKNGLSTFHRIIRILLQIVIGQSPLWYLDGFVIFSKIHQET